MSDSDFDDDIDKLLDEFETTKSRTKAQEDTPAPQINTNTKYRSVRPSTVNVQIDQDSSITQQQQRPISPKKLITTPAVQRPSTAAATATSKPGSFLGTLNRDRDGDSNNPKAKGDASDWLGLGPSAEPSPLPTPRLSKKPFELEQSSNPRERIGKSEETFDEDSFLKKLSSLKQSSKQDEQIPKVSVEAPKQQLQRERPSIQIPKEQAPRPQAQSQGTVPSFMEKLSIPPIRPQSVEPESLEIAGAGDPGAGATSTKKKVYVRKSTGQVIPGPMMGANGNVRTHTSTLQVPSHLIDEDELKLMSTSLKTLYGNQVELIEKSYKEQLECLAQSFGRKEEMLKEENRMMQKEYEVRINKLKNDLLEVESKSIHKTHQDSTNYQSIMEQLKLISSQNEKLFSNPQILEPNISNVQHQAQIIAQEINTSINSRLLEFLEKISTSTANLRNQETSENSVILQKLDKVSNLLLENAAKLQLQQKTELLGNGNKGKDTETRVASELSKVLKEHKKLRSTLIKTTVSAMTQSLETNNQNQRKKDKISSQMKEFRKDFQRVMLEIDLKQESLHKSQVLIESHLSTISRNLTENLWKTQGNFSFAPHPQPQESIQNEIELKLLQDERNALSEKIAMLNIDKRKLNDERVQFENDKRDFERDKLRIHDLETMLKIKVADAENMKKEAEILRLENIKLNGQLSKKLNELDQEYMQNRNFESNLQHQRQKSYIELNEIQREKEMLEKLRQELLCPGCLKYIPPRSHGDGIDIDDGMKLYYAPLPHSQLLPKFNLDDF